MAKYPPKALSTLRGIARGRVGWVTACGEWIDNAFDRAATRVAITFEKGALTIADNGEGTPTPHVVVQLGEHTTAAEGLGEFGMGGKESLLWAGGERSSVTIDTAHRGVSRQLTMNWLEYARSEWDLPDALERPAEPGEVGTTIKLKPLQAGFPKFSSLRDELGYLYSRAIRQENRQITIKAPGIRERPLVVAPWERPEFDQALPRVLGETIQIQNKISKVWAGVVKEGVPNPRNGLTYYYRYRVILPNSQQGCGDYHPGRVCGFVELQEGWKSALTRNKNGIVVDDEELFAAVEQTIRPVLEAAQRVGSTFALRELSHRLETRIAAALGKGRIGALDAKAKREPGDEHGTVTPTDTGRKHQRARQEQPGTRFASHGRTGRALSIGHVHLGDMRLGEAKPPNITLNLDNPFISQAVDENNDDVLVLAVSSLIADWDCSQTDDKGNRYLRGVEPKAFPDQVGYILSRSPSLDGKPALRLAKA